MVEDDETKEGMGIGRILCARNFLRRVMGDPEGRWAGGLGGRRMEMLSTK